MKASVPFATILRLKTSMTSVFRGNRIVLLPARRTCRVTKRSFASSASHESLKRNTPADLAIRLRIGVSRQYVPQKTLDARPVFTAANPTSPFA